MNAIILAMSITFTSIRSGTVMRTKCGNGHIRPSAEWCGSVSIRWIGQAMFEATMLTLASDDCDIG